MSDMYVLGRARTAVHRLAVTTFTILSTGFGVVAFVPSQAQAGEDYIGEIVATAAYFCRRGTVEANGGLLPIADYQTLFSLLGPRYGGDERTTFGLPDLRDQKAQFPHRDWGQVRWCAVLYGEYPPRGDGGRFDQRIAGEVMPFEGGFCPRGWQVETAGTLPHQQALSWCKATGDGGSVNSFLAQMLLFAGTTCPQNTMAAEGQILQIAENEALFTLIRTTYGGGGRTTFALPNMASPGPGMKWCIVTKGQYPSRN